jgi:hypothetical protein
MLGVVGCGQFIDLLSGDLGQEGGYVRIANVETGNYLDIPVDDTILKGLIELSAEGLSEPDADQNADPDAFIDEQVNASPGEQPSVAEMFEDNVTPFAIGDEE